MLRARAIVPQVAWQSMPGPLTACIDDTYCHATSGCAYKRTPHVISCNSAWKDRFAAPVCSQGGCGQRDGSLHHPSRLHRRAYICDMQVHEANETDALFDLFHQLGIRDRKVLACVE